MLSHERVHRWSRLAVEVLVVLQGILAFGATLLAVGRFVPGPREGALLAGSLLATGFAVVFAIGVDALSKHTMRSHVLFSDVSVLWADEQPPGCSECGASTFFMKDAAGRRRSVICGSGHEAEVPL